MIVLKQEETLHGIEKDIEENSARITGDASRAEALSIRSQAPNLLFVWPLAPIKNANPLQVGPEQGPSFGQYQKCCVGDHGQDQKRQAPAQVAVQQDMTQHAHDCYKQLHCDCSANHALVGRNIVHQVSSQARTLKHLQRPADVVEPESYSLFSGVAMQHETPVVLLMKATTMNMNLMGAAIGSQNHVSIIQKVKLPLGWWCCQL